MNRFLASLLVAFSALDALLTIAWVNLGLALELNPIMNYFLEISPALFFCVKTTMVCGATLILVTHQDKLLAKVGLWLSTLCYTILFGYHIFHMATL